MFLDNLLMGAVFEAEGMGGEAAPNGAAPPSSLAALAGDIAKEQEQGGEAKEAGDHGEAAPRGDENKAATPAGTPYFPEGLGDDLRGKDDRETIDRLFERLNSQPRAPEKPEDYQLTLSPDQQARFGDLEADPVHKIVREVAHQAGLSNDQYQTVFTQVNDRLLEAGLLDTIDAMAELEKLMPKTGDDVERKASAARRINDVASEIKAVGVRAGLNEPQVNSLLAAIDTADGVVAFERVLKIMGDRGVQTGGRSSAQSTREGIRRQMKDPRYDSLSPDYDQDFRRRVDAEYARING